MRDITLEDTIYPRFTTRAFATGIPTTLSGTPVLSIYEENNLTQITAGVSVTADYDSVTGLNQATIVATAANGYEAGKSYDLVITTGTVGGVSVVGEVVFSFTIQDAPVNWANVTAPTTAVDLSGTDIQLCDTITTYTGNTVQTGDSFARIGVAGAGLTNINLPNQTMDITGNLSGSVGSVTGAVGSVTGAVGSVTGNVGGNVVGSTASVTGAVGSVTGNVGGNVAGSVGSNLELGPEEVNAEVSDVLKTDTIAEMAQGAPPATPTFEEAVMYVYMALRNKMDVTATLKEFHNDAGTVIWKKTLSDDGTTYSEAEGATGP